MIEEKIDILKIRINKDNLDELINYSLHAVEDKRKFYICTANAFVTVKANEDDEFLNILNNAQIVIADGMSSVWVSRTFKNYNLEKISGYKFFVEFSKSVAENNHKLSYYFLGGSRMDVLEKIKSRLFLEYPVIEVSGMYCPSYFDDMPDEENKKIIEDINDKKPDVLWVGLSAPKQEKWIYKNLDKINIKMACGIGAVFNFYSGNVKRAPVWMQNTGMEWLFRIFVEPKRLFKKYMIYNTKFIILVFKDIFSQHFKKVKGIKKGIKN